MENNNNQTKKISQKTTDGWQKVTEVLKSGGVVIIPSESSYGIAALASNPQAINKLYQIKKRADNKPSLVIVGSFEQAQQLVDFSPKAMILASKYWPGGLTIVLNSRKQDLPTEIYGEQKSLAIRLPDNQQLRDLALTAGPFILPSANFNGQKPPFTQEEIDPELIKLVDFVLGEKTGGNPVSTLVDARKDQITVLRQGSVKIS